jgi:hypothetical protein
MRVGTNAFRLALGIAALLSGAAATPVLAADAVPPTQAPAAAAEPLEELDQIVVRGESIIKAIADAEDNFYALYNKLDKDDDYHTSCVYLQLDARSQIRSRVCIPGFVADAMADQASFAAACLPDYSTYDTDGNGRITMQEAQSSQDLFSVFSVLDYSGDGSLSLGEYLHWATWSTANCYHPPPPQLVLMERSKDWAVHMMKVINSDPRLKDQAGHLDDLYQELRSVQLKYSKAKGEELPEKTTRRELGPRVH